LKAGIVEPEEAATVRHQFGKHVSGAMTTHVTVEELLGVVFFMRSLLYRILKMQQKEKRQLVLPRTSCFIVK
jgi:hypothetical protein